MSRLFPEGYITAQIGVPFHTLKGSHNGDPNLPQNPDSNAPRVRDGIPWHRQEDRTGPHDSGLAGPTDRVCVSVSLEAFEQVERLLSKAATGICIRGLGVKAGVMDNFTADQLVVIGQAISLTRRILTAGLKK